MSIIAWQAASVQMPAGCAARISIERTSFMKALKIVGTIFSILLIVGIFSVGGVALMHVADRYMAEGSVNELIPTTIVSSRGEESEEGIGEDAGSGEGTGSTVVKEEKKTMPEYSSSVENKARTWLSIHTTEEKVAQLFMITPEALTGVGTATVSGNTTKTRYEQYPVGGIIYFAKNLTGTDQTKALLSGMQKIAMDRVGVPVLLGVDEEGGRVARIANNPNFGIENVGDMREIGDAAAAMGGITTEANKAGKTIGTYLADLGFNMDFAPVADVLDDQELELLSRRAFGKDPELVAALVSAETEGMLGTGVAPVLKHFPGHGSADADSHTGAAVVTKAKEELEKTDLVPFAAGISAGAEAVMVAHISLPEVTGDDTPATLSESVITGILRDEMHFDGVVITDAMGMGAITEHYRSGEAAVLAIEAGADIILMPQDFFEAYQAVLDAVNDGTISEDRLDESVTRILRLKFAQE